MKYYLPDEMNKCFRYEENYYHFIKQPTLHYPEESNWKTYSDIVADLKRATYHHEQTFVEEAFKECTYPYKEKLFDNLDVYITTYPHAEHVNAAADKLGIVLYGRGTQIPRGMTHYITLHELGHVFDYKCVTSDKDKLYRYYELRNWETEEVDNWGYNENKEYVLIGKRTQWKDDRDMPWQDKIIERFAEDFRYLFGGELAKQGYWGMKCDPPGDEIRNFMIECGR
jgi:hypothetical protein